MADVDTQNMIPYSCRAHAIARQESREHALAEWYGNKPHTLTVQEEKKETSDTSDDSSTR